MSEFCEQSLVKVTETKESNQESTLSFILSLWDELHIQIILYCLMGFLVITPVVIIWCKCCRTKKEENYKLIDRSKSNEITTYSYT